MIVSFPENTETYSMEEGLSPVLDLFFKGFFLNVFSSSFSQIKNPITVLHHANRFYWWVECALTHEKTLKKVIRNQYLNE